MFLSWIIAGELGRIEGKCNEQQYDYTWLSTFNVYNLILCRNVVFCSKWIIKTVHCKELFKRTDSRKSVTPHDVRFDSCCLVTSSALDYRLLELGAAAVVRGGERVYAAVGVGRTLNGALEGKLHRWRNDHNSEVFKYDSWLIVRLSYDHCEEDAGDSRFTVPSAEAQVVDSIAGQRASERVWLGVS